jgi:selenophosphate synthetase-related protein
VDRIPALSDNYIWLLLEESSGKVAVVDPSEFEAVDDVLQEKFAPHH